MDEGYAPEDIEIRYGKRAYDFDTRKPIANTLSDVQSFVRVGGAWIPASYPYEIEPNIPRGVRNIGKKFRKYGDSKFEFRFYDAKPYNPHWRWSQRRR